MVRINCHSAFKHYEMFHSNHCGGSNYGSIFNTTYNISCGNNGNHGGFWSGFGAGLGNAFGGLFTNMFGGMNFGGMSLWGGGMMPWGGATMPWFNSIGNNGGWWNNNANNNNTNNTNNDSSNSPVDKDNAKYNELEKDVNKLLEKAENNDSKKEAKKLYDEIKELYEEPLDPMNKKMNKGAYHDLMTTLEKKFPELKEGTDAAKDKKADNDGKAVPKAPTTGKQEVTDPTKAQKEAEAKATEEAKANENVQKIANAGSLDALSNVNYSKLTPEEKKQYKDKAIELAKKVGETPEELQKFREALDTLPEEVRIEVKKSFYEAGYSNVKESEITVELLGKLQDVIDASKIADFKNVTLGTPKKDSNGKWTIPVKTYEDDNGKVHNLNVPYVQVEVVDGEVIFHGKQLTQKYVLQTDGKDLHLMQYKYHEGYDKGDVTSQN